MLVLALLCGTGLGLLWRFKSLETDELPPVGVSVEAYLEAWRGGKYDAMYDCLSPNAQKAYSFEAFSDLYDKVFNHQLKLVGQVLTLGACEQNDEHRLANVAVTAEYDIPGLGAVEFPLVFSMVYVAEAWRLEFTPEVLLPELTATDTIRSVVQVPKRGDIFTQDGTLLATDGYADSLYAVPERIPDKIVFCARMAAVLETDAESIRAMIESHEAERDGYVVLKVYPPRGIPDGVAAEVLQIEGAGIDSNVYTPIRLYPKGDFMSHAIGYTGAISQEMWPLYRDKGYLADQKVGLSGLEYSYEETLCGTRGYRIQCFDENGEFKRTFASVDAVRGQDLWLSVDMELQERAQQVLESTLNLDEGQRGVIITLKPSTGALTSIASYPSYDNNIFAWPRLQQTWDKLNNDANQPLFDRTTQGMYPPGSTMKPLTAGIAMQAGLIDSTTVFPQEDFVSPVTGRSTYVWRPQGFAGYNGPPITRLSYVETPVDLMRAMVRSDNVYFAWVALNTGRDQYLDSLKAMGWGEPFAADISVKTGRRMVRDIMDNTRLLADMGYGQGELLTSPLQLASLYAGLANGGVVYKPTLVDRTGRGQADGLAYTYSDPTVPEVTVSSLFSQDILQHLQRTMHAVCQPGGTGSGVNLNVVSGKTGTAELDSSNFRVIAWFVGYIDDGSQDKLVLVMIETKTGGGGIRYDMARRMFLKDREEPTTPTPTPTP